MNSEMHDELIGASSLVTALVGLGISIHYYSDRPPSASISLVVTLPLGWRKALVGAGTAFWNEKDGPGVFSIMRQ
jgi:hypothetical protein